MLKVLGFLLKASFFAVVILVAAHMITWNGKTVSDQIKAQMAQAERPAQQTIGQVKTWAETLVRDTKKGVQQKSVAAPSKTTTENLDQISDSERRKLRALIRDLNSARSSEL